ncbi:MAG: choice-of-anchor D domain-containing protein, partial [Spartobacteria bacterium]|nr:choice-of-anchor D domain-containing protein [Spartobacteria bacterium]
NVMAYNALQSLTTSGGSGTGGVTFAVTSGPGEILVGPRLWVKTGTGIVTVVATKAQDENYFVTANTQQVTAVQAAQVISGFTPVDGTSFGISEEVTLSATASSGKSVNFAVVSGPASLSGNTMTFTGVGTVVISAGEPGDADWSAAPTLTNQYTVLAAPGLTVLGTNGTTIASGSAISLNKGTDFQGYKLGSVLTNTFSITNNGDQNLVISQVTLTGLTNARFRIANMPSLVNAKAVKSFQVVFEPQSQGRFSGTVSLMNNSPVVPFSMNLAGIGFVPTNTVFPQEGPAVGGTIIVSNLLLGSGMDITNAVLGTTPLTILSQSSNTVTLTVPPMSAGLYDITLQSASVGLTLLHDVYTVNPAGTVDELSPATSGGAGGVQITLVGTNLSDGTLSDILSVTLCGVTTTVDSVSGSTQLVVTAGSGGVGSGDAVIHSETFGWIVVSNAFTYNAPGMRILGPSSNVVASGAAATVDAGNDFGTLRLNAGATNAFEIMN